jgi:LysR family transcriptional regulator, nitrogen assimilation regulatory protein
VKKYRSRIPIPANIAACSQHDAFLQSDMDIRQLRYFVGVVQAGSLTRAADQLHVAQSAVSYHLHSLESELDRQLLTRGPKGIVLTDAGAVLYRHAEAILRQVEFAKRDTTSALNVPSGGVSIGVPVVLSAILSYELFARVRRMYPQIQLHISDANSWLVREHLLNGRIDLAVLFTDQPERGLAVEPLLLEELFYVTAESNASPIRIADAAQRPLLCSSRGGSSLNVAQEAFRKHGLTVTPVGEIDALGALLHAVASGIGNAILPWCALCDGDWKTALNLRRFADTELIRPIALCRSEVGQRSLAIDAVAQTLKSLVRELVESGTWQGVSMIAGQEELSGSLAAS